MELEERLIRKKYLISEENLKTFKLVLRDFYKQFPPNFIKETMIPLQAHLTSSLRDFQGWVLMNIFDFEVLEIVLNHYAEKTDETIKLFKWCMKNIAKQKRENENI